MPTSSMNSSTNRSPTLPENHPLTMARLQQSARDILKNLETAITNTTTGTQPAPISSSSTSLQLPNNSPNPRDPSTVPASLEQALRSMFTSCTFGAGVTSNCDDDDDDDDENDSRTTSTNRGVEKVGTSSTDSSSSIDASPVRPTTKRSKSATHPAKKMISSTKESLRLFASAHIAESSSYRNAAKSPPPRQPAEPTPTHTRRNSSADEPSSSKVAADHIYEHLFFAEEQARRAAAAAPNKNDTTITPNHSTQRPVVSPPTIKSEIPSLPYRSPHIDRLDVVPLRRMTQPFPMSKPMNNAMPLLSAHHQPIHPVSTAPNKITTLSRNHTFDDDISAISAHTLEAMMMTTGEQQHKLHSHFQITEDVLSQPRSISNHLSNTVSAPTVTNNDDKFMLRPQFPALTVVTPPTESKAVIPTKVDAFCRASTIPRANQGREGVEPPVISPSSTMESHRINSLSSSSISHLAKQRSIRNGDHNSVRSPSGLRYGTPTSSRSMSSNNSKQKQHTTGHSSFSPCTSGSGNQSFDQWRTVEQEFWDSVVANDDDNDDAHETGLISTTKSTKKGKTSTSSHRQPRRPSRSRFHSIDGWSERSHSRSRDTTTANSSVFSSSLTGISHGGSSHGTLPPQRSRSWLALHPQHHPHDTFPVIFASTAIPDNDGFFQDYDIPSSASFRVDTMDLGEI